MREPSWMSDPLGSLIEPLTGETFFSDYYEQRFFHARRSDPSRYSDLLSVDRVDEILATIDLTADSLEMARAEPRIHVQDFTHRNGVVDRGAVVRHYQRGASIILPHLHQVDETLARFCRALEQCLCAHIQTNVYLTPPDAQGFRTHYDDHDVFVVQVSGQKQWKMYESPVAIPYRGERFRSDLHEAGEVIDEFVLKAGEMVYVPRGLMHDAATVGNEPSLHITVGVIAKTWADLMLEAVSEVALRDPRFRRALPRGFAREDYDRGEAERYFRELVESFSENADFDEAFDLFVDNFIRSRSAVVRGGVLQATQPIVSTDTFKIREHVPTRLRYDDESALIICPEGEVIFERAAVPGLKRILDGKVFTLEVLAELDPETGLDSIKKLLAFGLVEKC